MKTVLVLLLSLVGQSSYASYVKGSGAFGVSAYRDLSLTAKWSLKGQDTSKVNDLEEDAEKPKDYAKILTSVQSTRSYGTTTNEYKLGYDSTFSDVVSYSFNGYYRAEPASVHTIGLEPSFDFTYDSLLMEDKSTTFTIGLEWAKTSTRVPLPPTNRLVDNSFTTWGLSLGITQEVLEGLKPYLTLSFYKYTEPQSGRFQVGPRRQINILPTDSALSTSGYPERTFTFGTSWEIVEKWSSSYYISSTKAHFTDLITIYSGLGVDYTFTDNWSAGVAYSWSSSGASTGSLDATYFW